mmetsp:Transcript_53850/g.155471  ORF Transcript_53850/g.155471 Transcript_53850/m.155471 type:complete len:422 (-) Transcript_53850:1372-2637(-)
MEEDAAMTMDSSVMPPAQRINPLLPETAGALLAEEWTIDPQSTLPSFLERIMIEETQRSTWETLTTVLSHLEDRLDEWSYRFGMDEYERRSTWKRRLAWFLKIPQVCRFLSHRILARYSPEIRFLVVYWLDRKSLLSKASAAISEALHGGKRVKLCPDPKSSEGKLEPMNQRDGIRLALLLALGRYLNERGEILYRKLLSPATASFRLPVKYQQIVKFAYSFLYTSGKAVSLIEKWLYLTGQSVFFDPYSRWLSVVLRRVTEEDSSQQSSPAPNPEASDAISSSPTNAVSTLLSTLGLSFNEKATRSLAYWLLASFAGISWIARLQRTRQRVRQRLDYQEGTVGSTHAPPKEAASSELLRNCPPTHCPLCRSPRVHPTASTSGFVFCLSCLTTALRSKAVCPVTGKDCPESSIVRLFEPHN